MKTIVIAGGTGFLGQVLEDFFKQKTYDVKILTRNPKKENHIYWDAKHLGKWVDALEGCEVLINMAGKSVDCRYNEANKKLIYNSRIDSTRVLGLAVNACEKPPKVWINSSTATIYEHSFHKEMTEIDGNIGDDFSMNIAKSWEKEFNSAKTPKTRKVILRTSIVLGKNGGAFIPLKRLVQFGLGGKQGNGQQKISWIHETDFVRAISFIIEEKLSGTFNVVSPKPIKNFEFMNKLRQAVKIPFGLPQPKWLLEIGSQIIKTETELVLKSRNVIPKRLTDLGFKFQYTNLENVFNNLLN